MMKSIRIVMTVFLLTWVGALFAATANNNSAQPLDKIVAIVNSQVITQSQVDSQMAQIKQQMQAARVPLPSDAKLRSQVLDQLIYQSLQMQLATRAGLKVTDVQVDKAISDIAAHNNMTLAQLQSAVQQQGMSYAAYRQQIHDQMIVSQVQADALGSKVTVSDKEVAAFLKDHPAANQQYHLIDVLLPVPANATKTQIGDINQQAVKIQQQLQQGGSLPDGIQATDLGWRNGSDIPDVFMPAIAKMNPGDVSGPIQAPNGIHVIKLVEERGSGTGLTTEQARQYLFQQKIQQALLPWLQKLRASAYVKVMD